MARNAGYSVENSFVNGLVTEATGLNFPENAVTETDNCVFDQTGTVSRRFGIDRETNFTTHFRTGVSEAISEYVWESVAGDGDLTLLVQQTGSILNFFNVSSSDSLSAGFINAINMVSYTTNSVLMPQNIFQFSAGLGKLVVTNPYSYPVVITYDKATNSFSAVLINIKTRDFKGVQPHPVSRLSSITDTHLYNLLNQGWDQSKIDRMVSMGGVYPSDYDVWWLYKTPDALGTEVFLTDVAVSSGILNQVDRGNSPAPKGSIILDEFYQDRSGATNVNNLPIVSSGTSRPATNAFHAGRIFYAGVNAEEYNSKVYFSQIIEGIEQFERCYQQNDPTSQYTPDILPSDGGVIAIPEAGRIYKLWSVDNSLLVFASTGVWQITGSSGIGFSATDYTVKKISAIQTISANSFVNVNGSPMWWGLDAIYGAAADTAGSIVISPISDERIKTYYSDIPEQSKIYAKGAFNSKDKIIQWVFRTSSAPTLDLQYTYDKILNFNTTTKAFYPWSLPQSGARIKGITSLKGLGSEVITETVVDTQSATVYANTGQIVFVQARQSAQISSQFKYISVWDTTSFTYANSVETTYGDWASFFSGTPLNAEASFITGYKIRGNAVKKAQSNYLRLYNKGLGALRFNTRWDYATIGSTGRWSSSQLVSFTEEGYEYTTRRVKVRGHGLVFQYAIKSYLTESFDIIGWTSFDTSNERP